jgi:hypothetical protein
VTHDIPHHFSPNRDNTPPPRHSPRNLPSFFEQKALPGNATVAQENLEKHASTITNLLTYGPLTNIKEDI